MPNYSGNLIAEADGTTGVAVREYIWLPGSGYAGTDLPVAVVDVAGSASPELLYVHADHLGRPIRLTDAAKATAWAAEWLPWGGIHVKTGPETLDARLPGQWFQAESGLHYNWHRHYDPTIGRYTQPDPLGFVDGPSVYAYARNAPGEAVDPDGRAIQIVPAIVARYCQLNPSACAAAAGATGEAIKQLILVCMAKGGRAKKENEYSREARNQPDPCAYLKKLYDETEDSAERQKIKTAQKVLGCRRRG